MDLCQVFIFSRDAHSRVLMAEYYDEAFDHLSK